MRSVKPAAMRASRAAFCEYEANCKDEYIASARDGPSRLGSLTDAGSDDFASTVVGLQGPVRGKPAAAPRR